VFCSDNATAIPEANCCALNYEEFVVESIASVETNPRCLGK